MPWVHFGFIILNQNRIKSKLNFLGIFYILSLFFLFWIVTFGGTELIPSWLSNTKSPFYLIFIFFLLLSLIRPFRSELQYYFDERISPLLEIKNELKILLPLAIIFLIIFIKSNHLDYFNFQVNARDFSYFDHLIPNTFLGKFFYSYTCDCNGFRDNIYLILFLFAPFQMLFNSPLFLLYLHGIVLWSAIIPLFLILKRNQIHPSLRFLLILAYLNFPYLYRILNFHFHIEVLYIPLFFWFFYFLEKKSTIGLLILTFLIGIVKSDGSFYLFSLFTSLILFKKLTLKKGKYFILFCSLLILMVILFAHSKVPHGFNFKGSIFTKITTSSKTLFERASFNIFDHLKTIIIGVPFLSMLYFSFTPLLTPWLFLGFLPMLALHSIVDYPVMNQFILYHSAPFIPFYFYGLILGLVKLKKSTFLFKKQLSLMTCTFLLLATLLKGVNPHTKDFSEFSPLSQNYSQFEILKNQIDLKKGILCTQGVLFPHFEYSLNLRLLRNDCTKENHKYYLFNLKLQFYPFDSQEKFKDRFETLTRRMDYSVKKVGDFYLFEKRSDDSMGKIIY